MSVPRAGSRIKGRYCAESFFFPSLPCTEDSKIAERICQCYNAHRVCMLSCLVDLEESVISDRGFGDCIFSAIQII